MQTEYEAIHVRHKDGNVCENKTQEKWNDEGFSSKERDEMFLILKTRIYLIEMGLPRFW